MEKSDRPSECPFSVWPTPFSFAIQEGTDTLGTFRIFNNSSKKLCWKAKSNKRLRYVTNPGYGIIAPRDNVTVEIRLLHKVSPEDVAKPDKFQFIGVFDNRDITDEKKRQQMWKNYQRHQPHEIFQVMVPCHLVLQSENSDVIREKAPLQSSMKRKRPVESSEDREEKKRLFDENEALKKELHNVREELELLKEELKLEREARSKAEQASEIVPQKKSETFPFCAIFVLLLPIIFAFTLYHFRADIDRLWERFTDETLPP